MLVSPNDFTRIREDKISKIMMLSAIVDSIETMLNAKNSSYKPNEIFLMINNSMDANTFIDCQPFCNKG